MVNQGLMMETEGGHRNSVIKRRNPIEFTHLICLDEADTHMYHKTKWSTSLRSRHIVDLALSESDQSLRSPGPAQTLRQRSQIVRRRSHLRHPPHHHHNSNVPKRVPDFNQPKNQAQADSEWGVDECGRMHGHQEIADGAGYQTSLRHFSFYIQPASTHQVITFPDVHVSADEDMPSSSRTFRVSSPTEALLDPESGSSYDDSEFSDDDDAEYLVTSAKKEIQQNLSDDEELPPQVRKKK
ncbi:hypothetical protein EVAR_54998_1 [Eumeta japonica]|uniref:Uncharacterized protein n=1 Tax=Eumeta variegata TaxID=151549 RepID=A0A4C1Z4Y9_EUMVA|nr:hypothetical protein EVAR_54998_1 [Eumeta japonica]